MTKERLSSKVAITTLLPLLLGVLAGCGGGGSSTSTSNNGGGSNGGASTLPAGTELLYVGDNAGVIHGFAVDPNSGKLTALATVAVTNPAAAGDVRLLGDLGGKILYATQAVTGSPNVASFLVDQTTGALTPNAGSPTLSVAPGKLAPGGLTSTLFQIRVPTPLNSFHSILTLLLLPCPRIRPLRSQEYRTT